MPADNDVNRLLCGLIQNMRYRREATLLFATYAGESAESKGKQWVLLSVRQ